MKKTFAVLAASVMGLATSASAQSALEIAQARSICGSAEVIAAEFLADGRLRVVCPRGSVPATNQALPATGLTGAGGLAALGAIVVVAAVAGGGGSSTTTSGGS